MNIIIANQKGGEGKTTHCILFSNYLVLERKEEILVLDLDLQNTLKAVWVRDRHNYANEPLYKVLNSDISNAAVIMKSLKGTTGHAIIDLPGNMDDDNIVPVYRNAGLVICPFSYERKSFQATYIFARVVRHLNSRVPIIFLPNRIRPQTSENVRQQSQEQLSRFGAIAPGIINEDAFQHIDTLTISSNISKQVKQAYGFIYENYLNKVKKPSLD